MNKENFHLVTSSIIETWKSDKINLLINEGCLDISRIESFKSFDYKFHDHPWDNRENLIISIKYLDDLSNRIIKIFHKKLNQVHNKKYSEKFWKILMRRWVDLSISVLYERWISTKYILDNNDNFSYSIIDIPENFFSSKDMEDFYLLVRTDLFNHYLYSLILKFNNFKKINVIKYQEKFFDPHKKYWYKRGILKSFLLKILDKINFFFLKKAKYFILDTYLGHQEELKLSTKLGVFGKPYIEKDCKDNIIDFKLRDSARLDLDCKNDFEKFLNTFYHSFIPKSYLENFHEIEKTVDSFNWPENPKSIFTSHSLRNDLVSFYSGKKTEAGTKLIVGQHGGAYFQFKEHWGDKKEVEFSDKFISWGFSNSEKIKSIGILKPLKKNINYKNNSEILLIIKSQSKYTQLLNSSIGVNQHIKYVNGTIKFAKSLSDDLLKYLLVRLHARKLGCNEDFIWKKNFPKVRNNYGKKNIFDLYNKSRIVVHSYAVTGYLETLAMNIPTIIFHDLKNSPFTYEATKDLSDLIECKIFHHNPETAASHLNEVYINIDKWWLSEEVQSARKEFVKKYCKINENKLNAVKDILKN